MARAHSWLLSLGALMTCASCESGDPVSDETSAESVYVAVIRHLEIPAPDADDERPIVYVADMNSEPLDLDAQVEVISVLDPDVDLRFVDDIGAAAETDDGSFAAPDDGWLVAVGTPVEDADTDTITLRVEASEPDDDPTAWQLHLDARGNDGEVTVVDAEELDPELLVPPVSP